MSHKCFSEIEYTAFAQKLYGNMPHGRFPFNGIVELTNRCNLKCAHCYCNQAVENEEVKTRELSTADLFRIFDDIEKRGCLWLVLTGGEPLVREDFFEIYGYAKKKGFLISLFTNATLVTPEVADLLEEFPPYEVEVTLYGATRDVYERVTGVRGSFDRCMAGIRNLYDRKIPLNLKTMAITLNKDELSEIEAFAKSIKAPFRFDPLLQSRVDGSNGPCRYRLSPEEVVRLDLESRERLEAWKEFIDKIKDVKASDSIVSCGAGSTTFSIDPYGGMRICLMCLDRSYDVKKEYFHKIWDERFSEILGKKHAAGFKCKDCDSVPYCDYCPGWAITEKNDTESVVEHLCEIAHRRKEAFESIK